MKKTATVLLCAFVLLAFAGCNSTTQKSGAFSFHNNSAQSTQNQNGTEKKIQVRTMWIRVQRIPSRRKIPKL